MPRDTIPETKSRAVKTYVRAWRRLDAARLEEAAAKAELALARGACTGGQLAEANRILSGGATGEELPHGGDR
jgi:hypothetical protein